MAELLTVTVVRKQGHEIGIRIGMRGKGQIQSLQSVETEAGILARLAAKVGVYVVG
jgi:hypothetical protein